MGCQESKTKSSELEGAQNTEAAPVAAGTGAKEDEVGPPLPAVIVSEATPAQPTQRTYRSSKMLLGKGASAAVYVGACEQTKEAVAIKRVAGINDPAKQAALLREYDTLRRLPRHRNVVQVEHFEIVGTDGIVVLELVRGGTLRHRCSAAPQRRLHESVIRAYMRDALIGLRHLHQNSVIHRDVKCDNILVVQKLFPGLPLPLSPPSAEGSTKVAWTDPLVKITDFGSCKDTLFGGVCQTTVNVVGTVPYMSPEAIKGKFSTASDVWAWAITFVELATPGQHVWQHLKTRDAFGLLLKIGTLPPADCKPPLPPQLSTEAKAMLTRCLSYRASARPSCDDLLQSPYFQDIAFPDGLDVEALDAYEASAVITAEAPPS